MTTQETASTTTPAVSGSLRPPVSRSILALVLLVVALSAVVRLWDLDRFEQTVFDEHYYVHDAKVLLHGGLAGTPAEPWRPAGVRSDAHPDLAKLAIAAGVAVFGDGPWGWRIPGALAGIALIALVFPVARRLGLSDEWALAALVLAASDPMLMLESRIAVLDMFAALATVLAVYLALRYVQSGFGLWWLIACAGALGAAVSCKWSGALAVLAVLIIIAPPLVRHGRGRVRPLAVAAALVLVPAVVYLVSSIPYFAAGHGLGDWLRLQEHMATFGWGVRGDRTFASRPVTWPFDASPIWYIWSDTSRGTVGLLAIGNFLLWWTGIAVWVVLGLLALLRRDWRLGLAPALVGALYLPWLLTTRQTYIYYMVPVVPFVAILVATGLARLAGAPWTQAPGAPLAVATGGRTAQSEGGGGEHRGRRLAAWAFCAACVVVGVLYVPFVLGVPVPFEYYSLLTPFTTWK
jgi:dolichyl-phosphate-mannose--protein O-mannosyl transferase